jgi:hypothetical protein
MTTNEMGESIEDVMYERDGWMRREEVAVKVARLLYFALNQVPSTKLNHPKFHNNNALLAHIDDKYRNDIYQGLMEEWFNG